MVEAVTGETVVEGMAAVAPGSPTSSAPDTDTTSNTPVAPGRLLSHYAPNATVRLDATEVNEGEAVLDFGGQFPDAPIRLDLSPGGDTVEAAANLYGYLRALDARGVGLIAVARVGSEGLAEAIRDRLERAAAGR
jgi:L-threonylcarbamoyladenylate synthase